MADSHCATVVCCLSLLPVLGFDLLAALSRREQLAEPRHEATHQDDGSRRILQRAAQRYRSTEGQLASTHAQHAAILLQTARASALASLCNMKHKTERVHRIICLTAGARGPAEALATAVAWGVYIFMCAEQRRQRAVHVTSAG